MKLLRLIDENDELITEVELKNKQFDLLIKIAEKEKKSVEQIVNNMLKEIVENDKKFVENAKKHTPT